MREVKTCHRCRHFKRRCDLEKPSCSRCVQAGVRCSFDINQVVPLRDPVVSKKVTSIPTTADYVTAMMANGPPQHMDHGIPMPAYSTYPGDAAFFASFGSNDTMIRPDGLISPTITSESPEPQLFPLPDNSRLLHSPHTSNVTTTTRVIRKRKRNCLSCHRCHRLKVKCDKELPCSRCQNSGNGSNCYYSPTKESDPSDTKSPSKARSIPNMALDPSKREQSPTGVVTEEWQITYKDRGAGHWMDLIGRIRQFSGNDERLIQALFANAGTDRCMSRVNLPHNFPFGGLEATKYYSRESITRLIESQRSKCAAFIESYFELWDAINPVVDRQIFSQEVERYWLDPGSADFSWLSQFLMVLGMGCFGLSDEPPEAIELMVAAGACLMQTKFMLRPNLLDVKALCIMVLAKVACNPVCWAQDSCWALQGTLMRTAHILGLPDEGVTGVTAARSPVEMTAFKKLWLTIMFMDIKCALCVGMMPQTLPEYLIGYTADSPDWGPEDSMQRVLCQALPTVLQVVIEINSKEFRLSYPDLLRYNSKLRELMIIAQQTCINPTQRILTDLLLRQCLMVLQRPYAMHNDGPRLYPDSYWGSLECAMALLMHFREFWCDTTHRRMDLVGRPFIVDIFTATLTAYVHVLRAEAPLSDTTAKNMAIPPRQIILDLLSSCVEIWAAEDHRSYCWHVANQLHQTVLSLIPTVSEIPFQLSLHTPIHHGNIFM